MKAKQIFKALAFAMLMPALLLTTACSDINNKSTDQEGRCVIPVTVKATSKAATTSKATYTDNGDNTGRLSFSAGDKLFVAGVHGEAGQFAGTLDYNVSEGKFSGNITTKRPYTGKADAFLGDVSSIEAELLPDGYGDYGYFSITENDGYDAVVAYDHNKTFATSTALKTAKAIAVEQFCDEWADSYSNNRFTLSPVNGIVNFTISGLAATTEVDVSLSGNSETITGKVTTDGSGNATFAIGVWSSYYIDSYTLTVDGKAIALPHEYPYAGYICNIRRSPAPIALSAVTSAYVGSVVTTDGWVYATVADATAASKTAVAMICYVSETGHGLAFALNDATNGLDYKVWLEASDCVSSWASDKSVPGGTWRLPSVNDIQYMLIGCGSSDTYKEMPMAQDGEWYFSEWVYFDSSGLRSKLATAATCNLDCYPYWTSDTFDWQYTQDWETWEYVYQAWAFRFYVGSDGDRFEPCDADYGVNTVRACLAF